MPYFFASILVLILVISFVFVARAVRHGRFSRRHTWLDREGIAREWEKIESLFARGDDMSWKLAVLEADKLLDHTLKSMAIPGKDLGERLKMGAYRYPKLRSAWAGHKIRNRLVHETTYHISHSDSARSHTSFAAALKAVGVL